MGSRNQSLPIERHRPPFGAAKDRAGHLERGARWRLARNDELARHLDPLLGLAEERVDAVDHLGRYPRPAVFEPIPGLAIRRQLCRRDKKLALEPEDDVAEVTEPGRQDAVLLL